MKRYYTALVNDSESYEGESITEVLNKILDYYADRDGPPLLRQIIYHGSGGGFADYDIHISHLETRMHAENLRRAWIKQEKV